MKIRGLCSFALLALLLSVASAEETQPSVYSPAPPVNSDAPAWDTNDPSETLPSRPEKIHLGKVSLPKPKKAKKKAKKAAKHKKLRLAQTWVPFKIQYWF